MRSREPGAAGINLGLIVTPMLDMSFQLLAFFIMIYHPSALEGHVDGALLPPSTPPVGKDGGVRLDKPSDVPDLTETIAVTVKAVPRGQIERTRSDGQPAAILLKGSADATAQLVADTDETLDVSLVRLGQRLKTMKSDAGVRVLLECQANLKHQYVMRVYDVCKGAGFGNIAFVAPRE